jgi:hypothetical protein
MQEIRKYLELQYTQQHQWLVEGNQNFILKGWNSDLVKFGANQKFSHWLSPVYFFQGFLEISLPLSGGTSAVFSLLCGYL